MVGRVGEARRCLGGRSFPCCCCSEEGKSIVQLFVTRAGKIVRVEKREEKLTTWIHPVLPPVTLGDGLPCWGSLTAHLLLSRSSEDRHSGGEAVVVWVLWVIWTEAGQVKREYQIYIFTLSCCIPFPALLISTAPGLLFLLLATESPGARTIVSGRIRRPGTEIVGERWR